MVDGAAEFDWDCGVCSDLVFVLGDCAKSKELALQPMYFNIIAIPKQSGGEFARSFQSLIEPPKYCEARP